jgi:hypothetical protein
MRNVQTILIRKLEEKMPFWLFGIDGRIITIKINLKEIGCETMD